MNKEKIIKQQSREALKGNWVPLLFSIAFIFTAVIAVEYGYYLITSIFGLVDPNTDKVLDEGLFYYITTACAYVLVMAFTPLFNGLLKEAYNVAIHKEARFSDLFTYFKRPSLYFKTLVLNLLLVIINGALITLFDFGKWTETLLNKPDDIWTAAGFAVVAASVIGTAFKIIVIMLFAYYPLTRYAVDDSRKIRLYAFKTIGFSFRHFRDTLRLFFSFFWWFALCFFVVPAMYVVPYYLTSVMNSVRWLEQLEQKRSGIR